MKRLSATLIFSSLLSCNCPNMHGGTDVSISNGKTTQKATVYVSFGSDSDITADDWDFCSGSGLNCSFDLDASTTKPLPNPEAKYLNATFSFDDPVGCGVTKAEVNVNNPSWYDILDVSLVDGYSNKVEISATPTGEKSDVLGPPNGQTGNEEIFGVFPYGCDICVERQSPPCGIPKGKTGCKAGTQYDPNPPCQYQGPTKGGGDLSVNVKLMP